MIIALDKYKRPLGFLTERRCRILMERKRAVLYRVFPTVVILMDVDARTIPDLPSFRIKIDPGSKYTGIAIIRNDTDEFVYAMQIEHRGDAVRAALNKRKNARRNRRSRETGYRRAKWGNRCLSEKDKRSYDSSREDGWLPPSIRSAADNVISWVRRLGRWINLTECSFEAVRFDTQLMEDPDIEGEEYQHGTLFGLEIKEYLMEKFGHTCQYCGGKSGDPVLEWEHMRPKSRGGSDRVKNALLSCSSCNKDKGNRTPEEWLELIKARLPREKGKRKELDEERVKLIQKVIDGKPQGSALRYAAWVSSSRRYLEKALFGIFGNVECSSGGRTKYNRTELGYPKEHHYDALCVGTVPEKGYHDRTNGYYLYAKAAGRGTRLRGHLNKCGVIATKWTDRKKGFFGFQTGDIVVAEVPHKTPKPYAFMGRVKTEEARKGIQLADKLSDMILFHSRVCENGKKMDQPWEDK